MQVLRLTFLTLLFAFVLTGCIVQADTFSDQNPFNAPDTLQSNGDGSTEPTPEPTETPTPTSPPPPTATPDKDDYIPTATPEYPIPGKE